MDFAVLLPMLSPPFSFDLKSCALGLLRISGIFACPASCVTPVPNLLNWRSCKKSELGSGSSLTESVLGILVVESLLPGVAQPWQLGGLW